MRLYDRDYMRVDRSHSVPVTRKLFLGLEEARWSVDRWRLDYNHYLPHS